MIERRVNCASCNPATSTLSNQTPCRSPYRKIVSSVAIKLWRLNCWSLQTPEVHKNLISVFICNSTVCNAWRHNPALELHSEYGKKKVKQRRRQYIKLFRLFSHDKKNDVSSYSEPQLCYASHPQWISGANSLSHPSAHAPASASLGCIHFCIFALFQQQSRCLR